MLILGTCIGLLAGCTDVEPTGVRAIRDGAGGSSTAVDLRADALIVIDDAIDRIVPALPDAAELDVIGIALDYAEALLGITHEPGPAPSAWADGLQRRSTPISQTSLSLCASVK